MSKSKGETWLISYGIYIVCSGGVGRGSYENFQSLFFKQPKENRKMDYHIKFNHNRSTGKCSNRWEKEGNFLWEISIEIIWRGGGAEKGSP